MGLSQDQTEQIKELLSNKIREKLSSYSPETQHMPFHVRLLGKDKMMLFSFIQSINTTLGTSIFEQIAEKVAQPYFKRVQRQSRLGDHISEKSLAIIQKIIDNLRNGLVEPNKLKEIEQLREVAQEEPKKQISSLKADIFLESNDGIEYYFDLKTAKPNKGEVIGLKRTLLEWAAIRLLQNRDVCIYTGLAIPYNPYAPSDYDRWTFRPMFDLQHELKVADDFWNFLGGDGTYQQLLDIFEEVGIALRDDINRKFTTL